jgi:hypothetical protein
MAHAARLTVNFGGTLGGTGIVAAVTIYSYDALAPGTLGVSGSERLVNSILLNSLALCGLIEKNDFIHVRIDA